jgi:hypothetical protein
MHALLAGAEWGTGRNFPQELARGIIGKQPEGMGVLTDVQHDQVTLPLLPKVHAGMMSDQGTVVVFHDVPPES